MNFLSTGCSDNTSSVNTSESTDPQDLFSDMSEKYALTLVAIYHAFAVLLMVNTLIAMMANTFNKIQVGKNTRSIFPVHNHPLIFPKYLECPLLLTKMVAVYVLYVHFN